MTKYYITGTGAEYFPQIGDILEDEHLVGLSFNSFFKISSEFSFDRLGMKISFFSGGKNNAKKENESLEKFFLRVAVESNLLFKK